MESSSAPLVRLGAEKAGLSSFVYRIQGQVKSPQIRYVFHTGVYAQIRADL